MKRTFSLLIVLILFSCTNKEKYYGEWVMTYPYSDYQNDLERIIITKDSISISSFPNFKKYSENLKLKRNKLELFGTTFNLSIENDSLLHFNNSTYIKKGYKTYDYEIYNNLVTVDYPEIKNIKNTKTTSSPHITSYRHMTFGKKLNSNEFALQLNDRLSEFRELWHFFTSYHSHDYIGAIKLTADKNSKMKDINDIFYYCRSFNKLKIKLVNNVNYYLNKKQIKTSQSGIYIYLNPFKEEELIQIENEPKILLPPIDFSLKSIIKKDNYHVLSLIKDEFYFDNQKVSKNDLSNVIEKNYAIEKHFIILYDDNSTYGYYLELMNIINKAIDKIQNEESLKILKKPLDSLSKIERREITFKIPKNIINGISFNDFKKLNIKIPELELIK